MLIQFWRIITTLVAIAAIIIIVVATYKSRTPEERCVATGGAWTVELDENLAVVGGSCLN